MRGTVQKRQLNKEANRQALVDAARRCFIEVGYDSVTVRDIIRRTDLASGTFYNYFQDKEELLREIVTADIQDLNGRLHAARAGAETVEGFLQGAYQALFQKIREEPAFFGLLMRNEHVVRRLFSETVVGLPMRALEADLRDAIARGIFPSLDVELLSAAFYGVGFEFGRALSQRPELQPEMVARFACQLLAHGAGSLSQLRLPKRSPDPSEDAVRA